LLQQTAARLSGSDFAAPVVITGEEQRFFVKRELELARVSAEAILLEPEGRNTSTAAALAAAWTQHAGREETLLLMPSDHVIGDANAFLDAVKSALSFAEEGAIVTFGANPTYANPQYGYIQAASCADEDGRAYPIERFIEKPRVQEAREFVEAGSFYWNAGIFLAKASTLIEEMRQYLPGSLDAVLESIDGGTTDGLFFRPAPSQFKRAENVSLDHGVMEKTSRGVVVPVEMDWSDVGSWDAVWQLGKKDADNNLADGIVVAVDTRNSLLRSDRGPLIGALGLDGIAIVAARDAVLVAPLDRAGDLKQLISELKDFDGAPLIDPANVARPWGSYESIADGSRYQVKHIVVDPGERLSLQMHYHRSEHWVVVRGSAEVTVGEKISILQENESTFIPAGTKHRLTNPGKVPLEIVEVQCGPYLGEDDIERFDDEYGRIPR
jgi:mannose-1-phosphate guanylyltransferase/mannose-6-phosphate isomerase